MLTMVLVAAALVAFAATLLAVPMVRWIALRRGWVDFPDQDRKVHRRPTPNVGGLAVAAGFFVGLAALYTFGRSSDLNLGSPVTAMVIGSLVMLLAGLYDDIHRMGFKKKFVVQLLVAYSVLLAGYRFDVSGIPFVPADAYIQALISVPLTLLWIVGIVNAVNLLDGLDGLASGTAMIAFSALAVISGLFGGDAGTIALAVLMVGAVAGFLIYNYSPASVFLGDSGSLFIGYLLAVYSLRSEFHSHPGVSLLVPAVVLGLPILDTSLCMIRRVVEGRSPYSPDSDHIHHRLDRLMGQKKAVFVMYGAALWFSAAALLMARSSVSVSLLVASVTVVAAYVGIRTLGYVDLNLFSYYMFRKTRQLAMDFGEQDNATPAATGPHLRSHHLDVLITPRTLPVRYRRHRAPAPRTAGTPEDIEVTLSRNEPLLGEPPTGDGHGRFSGTG